MCRRVARKLSVIRDETVEMNFSTAAVAGAAGLYSMNETS